MLIRSFRVRFLLWNVLLSGAVLVGFGVLTLGLSYRGGLARLDGDLRENARREFVESHHPGLRGQETPVWRSEYGGGSEQVSLALLIRERDSADVLLQSEDWPADLTAESFADPVLSPEEMSRPPPPQESEEGPPARPFGGRPPPPHELEEGHPARPLGGPPPPGGRFAPFPDSSQPLPPLAVGPCVSVALAEGNWRFGVIGQRERTLIIGVPLQPLQTQMWQLAQVLLIAFLPGVLLIGASGWVLTGQALRPVRALTKTAEGITARGLDQRLPVTQESREFKRLSDVFNGMLDRLEKSFQQATRFSADAAHELKTPLTILQGQLEESLREAGDNPEHQQLCAGLLEEVQRLKNIVRKLLLLSLADAGELQLHREEIDLQVLLENAVEDIGILAPELKVEFKADPPVTVLGDPDLLSQVLQNLVSNAIKYNGEDGFIRLELERTPKEIRLAVTNSGPPIPAASQPRLFERFYRGDPSHTRAIEGAGLGLSLAREIARAHGGDLVLKQSHASGTTFELFMPAG